MLNPAHNRHADEYRGKQFLSFPRDAMHPWQYNNKQFHNRQEAIERVAAEVSGVDDGVGDVLAALHRMGLDENTLVVYASDQGWMGGQDGIWGMGDHTRPIGAFELMMQIPFIFRQPGVIPANRTSDIIVSNYDFMPTVLSYVGLADRMPSKPASPGRDFSPILRGQALPWENVMYYEMETCRAVRTDRWKYVARFPSGPYELYDMQTDPHERFNLYGQPGLESRRAELSRRLDDFFARTADPQYDLLKGGRSKAKRLTTD
jgi:arylsulfatase A-like enzyme